MLLRIPDVLTASQVIQARQILAEAEWIDWRTTAGHQSASSKNNMHLSDGTPAARQLGDLLLQTIARNPLFISAALPLQFFPPYSIGIRMDRLLPLTWTTPFDRIAKPLNASVQISRLPYFSATRTSMTVENWLSETHRRLRA